MSTEPPQPAHEPSTSSTRPQTLRVWDLPTRLFHWALATCVLGALVTGSKGGDAMVWHLRFGQALLALLAFRILWAFVGGRWSRFRHFQWRPGRGADTGHAFPGSWSVLIILSVLSVQVGTGLMADDEIATTGPLVARVSEAWVRAASAWHKGWGEVAVWSLVGLHLSAIAWYVVRGRSLVEPMVGGDRVISTPPNPNAMTHEPSRDDRISRILAVILFIITCAFSAWVFSFGALT